MKMQNSALEKVAVKKVKHEVDVIIESARTKLEEYIEDESDISLLSEVLGSLIQVERTLQLVQINGAAVLSREMCEVVEQLIASSVSQPEKAYDCLSRGILQMSDYLEYVQAGNKDLPVVLLPLLNDLRGVREAPLLSEHILFFPDLDDIEVPSVNVTLAMSAQEYAKKIRYGFQTGLVGIIQNKEIDIAATKMCKVAIRLHQSSSEISSRRLWWVTSAIAQALAIDGLSTSTGLASLLGQVDRQIKRFIELGETEFAAGIQLGLIKNLLYYVGISNQRGRIVTKVKQAYGLDALIPNEFDIDKMRDGMSGPSADVLEAVSKALHEDIETVKDSIELYVHSKNRSPESVSEVGKELQKIADTLSMLGLDEPREDVLREVSALKGLSADELEHADSNFIAIAETLIKAENIVENFVNYRVLNKPAVQVVDEQDDDHSSSSDSGQLRKIQVQTITEALSEIEETKNIVSDMLATPEEESSYKNIQDRLRMVIGALSVLNLNDAAKILECMQIFLLDGNAAQELSSKPEMLDAFADSLTSVECYLEALIVDEGDPRDILEHGIRSVSKLVGSEMELSEEAEPVQTVDVEELAVFADDSDEDELALLSSADLELKKKLKNQPEEIPNSALNKSDSEELKESNSKQIDADGLDLEDLSATSLDISIDYDLIESFEETNQQSTTSEDFIDFDNAEDKTEALELPDIELDFDEDVELSPEFAALESTSIEEASTELDSMIDEIDHVSDADKDNENDESVGVVEVDLEATNLLDLNEIEEELNSNIQAYDLDELEDSIIELESEMLEQIEPDVVSDLAKQESVDEHISEPELESGPYSIAVQIDNEEKTLLANRGDSDEEVLEIFIEEAEEEIEKINLNRSIWKDDVGNADALTIIRRSFHTLKGGGRLIGAEIIGEYSWQLENILNKVIDSAFSVSNELHELLESSVDLLNELVLQLKNGHTPTVDVRALYVVASDFLIQSKSNNEEPSPNVVEEDESIDFIDPNDSHIKVVDLDVVEMIESQQEEIPKDDDNLEDELYALFLDEAKQHVSRINDILEPKKELKILAIDEVLLHALHTLFGCSRTAQVDVVAKLIGPLDKYCQESSQSHSKLKAEQFDVFVECIEYVDWNLKNNAENLKNSDINNELLQKINGLTHMDIPVLEDVVESVQEDDPIKPEPEKNLEKAKETSLSETNMTTSSLSGSIDLYEGKDEDLVEIFLEEANDILEVCNQCLDKWRVNKQDQNAIAEFRRQMHTLKGSARMAAYANIGDFSHEFETFVVDIAESRVESSEDMFNVVQRCLDQANDMVDVASSKEPVYPATDLIAELKALRSGEVISSEKLNDLAPEVTVPQDNESEFEQKSDENNIEESKVSEEKVTETKIGRKVKIPVLRNPVGLDEQSNMQPVISAQQAVRLQSSMLDNLVNNAGEVNIFQARLEQVSSNFNVNIFELEQVVDRLRDQLRNLEIETETQILSRHAYEEPGQEDFDPLELDRYSNIQQLSRSLAESVNDLLSIKDILSDQFRESEMLLSQQKRISGDLQQGLMRTRMVQFNQLVPRLQRIVRQTSRELKKDADLKIVGQNTEVDSSILNRIVAPLEHLVRNAISHGIEDAKQRDQANKPKQGEISIDVTREGSEVVIVVSDDGAGLDVERIKNKAIELDLMNEGMMLPEREILNFILTPGFSTAKKVSQVSGRGVGMDVVASELKQLGGSLQIDSEFGKGVEFVIRIPITLAITQSLLIKCGSEIYAVPLASVEGVVRLSAHELKQKYSEKEARYHYADRDYRLCHLGNLLDVCQPQLGGADKMFPVLLVRSGDSRMAIHVEATLGNREIVVKPLASQLSRLPVVSGATILGDGNVVLILDVPDLIRMDAVGQFEDIEDEAGDTDNVAESTVMVVDDSITIRKVTTRFLERNNYKVATAKDGVDAVQKLQDFTPALILLDIEMPRMDGYELATHVRNNERLKHVPIIMITSRTGEKHRQRAMDIGVQEYLGKPYNESELLSLVKKVVD